MLKKGMELFSTRYRQVSSASRFTLISWLSRGLILINHSLSSVYFYKFDTLVFHLLLYSIWKNFNPSSPPSPGYYRVNYDEENWKLLNDYLNSNNYTELSPITRAQLIDDALNLARVNQLLYDVALNLTLYLHKEVDYMPWQTTFRNLNFLNVMMRTSDHYQMFNVRICEICYTSSSNG